MASGTPTFLRLVMINPHWVHLSSSRQTRMEISVASLGHVPVLATLPPCEVLHAEAFFAHHRLRSDVTKTNHVVSTLDEEGVRSVCDLLGPNVCYENFEQWLITTFAVSQLTRFHCMVQPCGLGDHRPSQLFHDMHAILPDGIGEDGLRQFWLQKLLTSTILRAMKECGRHAYRNDLTQTARG